jgi:hypothetical protein
LPSERQINACVKQIKKVMFKYKNNKTNSFFILELLKIQQYWGIEIFEEAEKRLKYI